MLTKDKLLSAKKTLQGIACKTNLSQASGISSQNNVFLKEENLQKTGSFKLRGAYNKISSLTKEECERGVVACSAGNHAQGVAFAASRKHIKATICIPSCAPISKIEKTRSYGAEVCLVDGVYDDAYAKACAIQKESGAVMIHPFDDDDVIAGQGTVGLEILEQLPDVDAVIVPVGGGGLISGVAFAIKMLKPSCKVLGVQASGAPGMVHALKVSKIEALDNVSTLADGIAVKCPGKLTYEYCRKYVDDITTVTDDEIAMAILYLIEEQKIVAEGAGAASVATMLFNKFNLHGKNVACVVSGGNIDVTALSRIIDLGLMNRGRLGQILIKMADKPGEIKKISSIISKFGGNIISIYHDRNSTALNIHSCFLSVCIEVKDSKNYKQICDAITQAGYVIISK